MIAARAARRQTDRSTRLEDRRDDSGSASFLNDNRVCFNIRGNKYRLIVRVLYRHHAVYIRFIGTHKQYDKIDADTV